MFSNDRLQLAGRHATVREDSDVTPDRREPGKLLETDVRDALQQRIDRKLGVEYLPFQTQQGTDVVPENAECAQCRSFRGNQDACTSVQESTIR